MGRAFIHLGRLYSTLVICSVLHPPHYQCLFYVSYVSKAWYLVLRNRRSWRG